MCAILDPDDDICESDDVTVLPMLPTPVCHGANSGEAHENWLGAVVEEAVKCTGMLLPRHAAGAFPKGGGTKRY